MRTVATAAAWMAAGAVTATVLTGVAVAASQPQQAPGAAALAAAGTAGPEAAVGPRGRAMMRDVLHGSFTIDTGEGTAVVDVQRGELTAASATSITVRSSDGYVATYALDGDTSVRRDRDTAAPADLAVGDTVMVRATAGTADVVRALSPEALADLQERRASGMGGGMGGMGGMGSGLGGMGGGGGGMGMGWDA